MVSRGKNFEAPELVIDDATESDSVIDPDTEKLSSKPPPKESGRGFTFLQGINSQLQEEVMKRVSVKAGITAKDSFKIKPSLMPKRPEQQDIILNRRILYDISFSVREALALIIVFIYGIQLHDIIELFMSDGKQTGKGKTEKERAAFGILLLQSTKPSKIKLDGAKA